MYEFAADTVIDCVVAPLDHVFNDGDEDDNTTLPPEQNVVAPPAVIVGVAGVDVTVTVVLEDGFETQAPLFTLTV